LFSHIHRYNIKMMYLTLYTGSPNFKTQWQLHVPPNAVLKNPVRVVLKMNRDYFPKNQ
jgi:hypothetical protein